MASTQMDSPEHPEIPAEEGISRRDFLAASGLVAVGAADGSAVRFGIVADAHYADTETVGSRHYRESLGKMTECVRAMSERDMEFLVELGDLKDEDPRRREADTLRYLRDIERVLATFPGPHHHVLGNHDMDSISKSQFLDIAPNPGNAVGRSYYSFDTRGVHFVVLDANFRADTVAYDHGNFDWTEAHIPPDEVAWLRNDLRTTPLPVVCFVHQQLDGDDAFCVRNAAQVRDILEGHGNVLAVFQGHNHPGRRRTLGNIHYYTLHAMVEGTGPENNAYAVVDVRRNGDIQVTGYRQAASGRLERGGS